MTGKKTWGADGIEPPASRTQSESTRYLHTYKLFIYLFLRFDERKGWWTSMKKCVRNVDGDCIWVFLMMFVTFKMIINFFEENHGKLTKLSSLYYMFSRYFLNSHNKNRLLNQLTVHIPFLFHWTQKSPDSKNAWYFWALLHKTV